MTGSNDMTNIARMTNNKKFNYLDSVFSVGYPKHKNLKDCAFALKP
jgi:hypothetical protein